MRRLLLALTLLSPASAFSAEWCEIPLRSKEGHDILIRYQIVGAPSRAGTFKVEDFVVSVFGVPAQTNVQLRLTDVHAHGLSDLNQTLILNLQSPYVTETIAHEIDGRFHTSANNKQELSFKVGDNWLVDPINGTYKFQVNFGEHLWDGLCTK